jgi:hypothetical protein
MTGSQDASIEISEAANRSLCVLPVGSENCRRPRNFRPPGHNRNRAIEIHCREGIAGDQRTVSGPEKADVTWRMPRSFDDLPSGKPGELSESQSGYVGREINFMVRRKAHHLCQEASNSGISGRIAGSSVHERKLHAMYVDAHAPATRKRECGTGVVKMTVRQNDGARSCVPAKMLANGAEDFLLISRSAGVNEHKTFFSSQKISIGNSRGYADYVLSDDL